MFAEQQGDASTSCPGAKRRQKRMGEGGGRWVENTHFRKPFEEHCLNERDGNLALAQDRTPSRGEPGEPRRSSTYQRTPSPKLGGKEDKMKNNETHRRRNLKRNKKRGND